MSEDSLVNIHMKSRGLWFPAYGHGQDLWETGSSVVSLEWRFTVPYKSLLLRGDDLLSSLLEMRWAVMHGTIPAGNLPVIKFDGLGLEIQCWEGGRAYLRFLGHIHPSLAYYTRMWGVLTDANKRFSCAAHPPMNTVWKQAVDKAVTELGTTMWEWYQEVLPLQKIQMGVSLNMGIERVSDMAMTTEYSLTLPLRSL